MDDHMAAKSSFSNRILGQISKIPLLSRVHERLLPVVPLILKDRSKILFSCTNSLIKYRIDTFYSKEPKTVEWIDTIPSNEVLFDIGANIGLYSLYAASKGVNVFSFEPDSQNYAILNRNIFLNKFDKRIQALNLALSNKMTVTKIMLSRFMGGYSLHQIDPSKQVKSEFQQGIVVMDLDSVCPMLEVWPDHLKIDVDGNELNILLGAKSLLSSGKVKSILIEVTEGEKDHQAVIGIFKEHGYSLKEKHPLEEKEKIYNFLYTK